MSTVSIIGALLRASVKIKVEEEVGTGPDAAGLRIRWSVKGLPVAIFQKVLAFLEEAARQPLENGAVVTSIETTEAPGPLLCIKLHGVNVGIYFEPEYSGGQRVNNRTMVSISKTAG